MIEDLGNTSSVTDMLENLNWETLSTRRTKSQLTMMFKILHNLVDIPADDYLTPASTRTRALHTKKLQDSVPPLQMLLSTASFLVLLPPLLPPEILCHHQ